MALDDSSTVRTAVRATVACMLSVAVVSGPLVGAIDLTRPPDGDFLACEGGTASVEIEEPPGGFTLTRGEFGAGTYTVSGETAEVRVEHVVGCPRLLYRLRIPALGFDARQVHFVDEGQRGELALAPPAVNVSPDRVDRTTYEGTVTIELEGDSDRVLYRTNVSVEVVE